MHVLVGPIARTFHNLSSLSKARLAQVLDPNSHAASRPFAIDLRDRGSDGVV